MHVKLADEAVCIGPAPARQSYLCMDKVLEAVQQTGAQAVHPGYGFLSENADFVRLLEENNVAFIGPNANAITGMGDKIQSKKLAIEAEVNTIPGSRGEIQDVDHCIAVSRKIGYPVMIKASAGGGGKGMRVARNDEQAREGFRLSQQEAASSFGDDRILVEKFVDSPRHIEIQVLADQFNNAIYLNERECSIQRRNQKVIEEAPSVFLDAQTRRAMGEQAVALARRIGYSSAGTVEFLVDAQRNFYFLEMNTRLQVEHPITECITGVDLVHQMIRVASGHKLKLKQEDIPIRGWAIESRVYAEDPFKNFGLPSVGRLSRYMEPNHLPGVRCDSGVEEGSDISIYYDPMICKLVAYGQDRSQAVARSLDALDSYVIRGVTHNVPLLRDILAEPRFVAGDITTNYLPEVYPDGFRGHQLTGEGLARLAAVAAVVHVKHQRRSVAVTGHHALQPTPTAWDLVVLCGAAGDVPCAVRQTGAGFEVTCGEHQLTMADDFTLAEPVMNLTINGQREMVQLVRRGLKGDARLRFRGTAFDVQVYSDAAYEYFKMMPKKEEADVGKQVTSPMPGLVKSVAVSVGDMVSEGQEVCVIEAMKMQNSLVAAATGKVRAIHVKEGDTVEDEQILVELE
ncbi:propionyl-CoA carboxylase alpha chain, mitochondrial-like [Pollicipes pollicipes]|uniref:propionyl-CoA carboxylase alpha chain, mitochondrial-like n=1 Tax=Pollicipes pollicipes TaxID=41117 RepID=UPI001884BAB0|nr:propionyl-CoA carboxylase alpha chain, mitochondrial-like [Pollicipes pollicipes]